MIIYNVTINIDKSVEQEWLNWMQQKHIKEVLDTNLFLEAKLLKILVDEELGGVSYAVQYLAKSKADLASYYTDFAPKLRQEGMALFGDKMVAFRTELEVIEQF